MLNNYELVDVAIGIIANNKVNAGQKFVSGRMKNLKYRMERKQGFVLFREMDEERFDAIVNAFPKTGNNPRTGEAWNGENTVIVPADFKYEDAIKGLHDVDGFNALLFEGCEYESFPLPGLYVRKYTQAIGGHAAGTWVREPDGNYVAVIDHIDVLTMKMEDGTPLKGWDAATQARSQMKQLIRLEEALKPTSLDAENKPCEVAARYRPDADIRVPSNDAAIDDK